MLFLLSLFCSQPKYRNLDTGKAGISGLLVLTRDITEPGRKTAKARTHSRISAGFAV